MSTALNRTTIVRKRVSSLRPSPENAQLYRPMDHDPGIDELAESIRKNGLHEILTVTADNYIVSGHRRHAALLMIGRRFVKCAVLPFRRDEMNTDEYIALLREHNRQRNKTVAEQMREELVDIDPAEAHERLRKRRHQSIFADEESGIETLHIEGQKRRYGISEEKCEHVRLIKEIIEGRRVYWPLSVRGVHYPLLNYDFVRGYYWPRRDEPDYGTKRELRYRNDNGSYQATSDLITRLRLIGEIPWEAFDDFTRPLKEFRAFCDARQFVRQEIRGLFGGYWRDLLQTQPNHIEVVCEKNTIYHMVLQVTERYQIPTSSGRGFNSIDPWHDLAQRYKTSGKQRLIVIVLSDFDPEGEMIPQVGGRTLRDDFGVNVEIVKAGVTRQQIEDYKLPEMNFAKETSSNYDWFLKRTSGDPNVYELEALDPPNMLGDLEKIIRGVIDVDLYNREVEAERDEAAYLESARRAAMEALKGIAD